MKKSNVVAICVFCVLSVTAGYLWQNRSVQTAEKNRDFRQTTQKRYDLYPHARSIAAVEDLRPVFRDMAVGYIIGHALVSRFDKCLDNTSSSPNDCGHVEGTPEEMVNTKIYNRILAHRGIMEEIEHTIEDVYMSNVNAVVAEIIAGAPLPQINVSSEESSATDQGSPASEEDEYTESGSSAPVQFLRELGAFMDATSKNVRTEITGLGDIDPDTYKFGASRLLYKQRNLMEQVIKLRDKLDGAIQNDVQDDDRTTDEKISRINLAKSFINAQLLSRMETRNREYEEMLSGFNTNVGASRAEDILNKLENRESADKLYERIEVLAQQISELRAPDSATNCPSTGSNGNITGNTFPANTWSMTYDDGPNNSTSRDILRNLQNSGVKASFYMLARQVEQFRGVAEAIRDAGMEIALHSYTHRDIGVTVTRKMNSQSTPAAPETLDRFLEYEISDSKDRIEELLGVDIKNFRLPYGSGMSAARRRNRDGTPINNSDGTPAFLVTAAAAQRVRQKIADEGMMHIFWNVDSLDWQDTNHESVTTRVMRQVDQRGKGVILYHDIHPQSVTSSNDVITRMLARNSGRSESEKIKFKTTQEILDVMNGGNCP